MDEGFVHQAFALKDAEAVLFVDGHETKASEFDVVFDQGVRADDEFGFTGANAVEDGGFVAKLQGADEQFDAVSGGGENSFGCEIVLHGENFGRSHESGLKAVFDGDDGGLQSNDGFAAA